MGDDARSWRYAAAVRAGAPAAVRAGAPAAVFAASLQLMLVRLLVPSPIGLADNGDGPRLICQLDVGNSWPRFEFVAFHYPPAKRCGLTYPSTQLLLDRMAKWLGSALGGSGLNLVDLGLLCSVIASAGITMIAFAVRLPLASTCWGRRIVLAALLWLVVADSAFFGYFASVYSEAAALLGILLLVAGYLMLHRNRWWPVAGGALVAGGGVLATGAKVQTAVIILPLAVMLLAWRPAVGGRHAFLLRCLVPVVLTAAVVFGSALVLVRGDATAASLREINAYNTIFNGIVDGKHDTRGDLADLGLPPHTERYAGRTWWEGPAAHSDDPAYPEYRDKITLDNITRFYATHPVRTLQLLNRAARDLLTARVYYLGSYGSSPGRVPGQLEYRVPVVSALVGAFAPLGLFVLLPLWALLCWLGVRAARRGGYELCVVILFLLTSAALQFGVAALSEGHEGTKHQTVALYCTLLAGVLALATLLLGRGQGRMPDQTAPGVRRTSPSLPSPYPDPRVRSTEAVGAQDYRRP